MQQFNFPFCEEYSHSLEFKTSIVRRFDGSEQRQALNMCPKRSFNLNFEANKESKASLEGFFQQQKGDFDSFLLCWDESKFGNKLDYTCFLDSSKLSQMILPQSYATIPLSLAMIDDGNVLKGRYFLDDKYWSSEGNASFMVRKASYQGVSTLFQSGVLNPGQTYRIKVKTQDVQGLAPVLSTRTTILNQFENIFFEGGKTIEFVAVGTDLVFEMPENSSGSFCEVALFEIGDNTSQFDFQPNVEHQSELLFATLKDEILTFHNARQNLVEKPLRRWVLTFELTPSEALRFEAFFIAKKGRYKAFEWVYNDEKYMVRFDSDKLDQKQYQLGYREIKIPVMEVLQ